MGEENKEKDFEFISGSQQDYNGPGEQEPAKKQQEEPVEQSAQVSFEQEMDKAIAKPVQEKQVIEESVKPAGPKHVLPPKKYKLKILLMFSDFLAIVLYIYILLFISMGHDVKNDTFSFISNRMFAFYFVVAITIALLVFMFISKRTKSARTRFERDNELREDENIKVWLTGYDWGWPVLFLPTMALMVVGGIIGVFLNGINKDASAVVVIQNIIGGTIILFGALNAAVVIFKLKPVTLGFLLGGVCVVLLILLLHGPSTFAKFFNGFRVLGVANDPLGYLLLAYIWSIFLRVIWVKSLFFYWVFLPNRLELQHGLSESNESIDRNDLRHQIDTDDVILRWFNVGVVTFYFPQLDRMPISNVVLGIHKKALFANRIASVKTIQGIDS